MRGTRCALAFKTAVAIRSVSPTTHSRKVGAHFGLTSKCLQSGNSVDVDRHVSRQGDAEVNSWTYEQHARATISARAWRSLASLRLSCTLCGATY